MQEELYRVRMGRLSVTMKSEEHEVFSLHRRLGKLQRQTESLTGSRPPVNASQAHDASFVNEQEWPLSSVIFADRLFGNGLPEAPTKPAQDDTRVPVG